MSESGFCIKPDTERVVSKVMDGEAVIIDVTTGTYYSLRDSGGRAWGLIEKGSSLDEIAATLAQAYVVSPEQARADLEDLVAQLRAEKLVTDAPTPPATGAESTPSDPPLAYTAPTLEIFRDMQDLLALDPPMPGLSDIPWKKD